MFPSKWVVSAFCNALYRHWVLRSVIRCLSRMSLMLAGIKHVHSLLGVNMRSLQQAEVSTVVGAGRGLLPLLLGSVVGTVEALLPLKLQLGGVALVGVNAELHQGIALTTNVGLNL
jgi:hypothetical protein